VYPVAREGHLDTGSATRPRPRRGVRRADHPRAAAKLDELFSDAASRRAEHPALGRAGVIARTRELIPQESCRVVYEISGDTVWILSLVHTARQSPPVRTQATRAADGLPR
jgi:plasmid stabilization system protein ParE